jgi:hypothetical protein
LAFLDGELATLRTEEKRISRTIARVIRAVNEKIIKENPTIMTGLEKIDDSYITLKGRYDTSVEKVNFLIIIL